jgi:serine/alanine adding enzyme
MYDAAIHDRQVSMLKQIDNWAELVECDPDASILHDHDLTEIIEEIYNCKFVSGLVESEAGMTGVPGYQVGPTIFGQKITSQPFSFYPGLLGAKDEIAAFLHLIECAKELGSSWYVEYKSFGTLSGDSMEKIGQVQKLVPLIDSVLELKTDRDAQLSSYTKSLRQNLRTTRRRMEEKGIILRCVDTERDVKGLYNVLTRLNRDKHRMISHPYSLFRSFYQKLKPLGKAEFYVAEKEREILAGTILLRNNHHWEYCWGAADATVAKIGINTLLVDMMINDAVAAGAKTMGFGSSSPNDETLLKFKSRWGCVNRPINHYYWNTTPRKVDLNNGMPLLRSLIPHVPLKVIQLAAPYAVRLLA